MSFKNPKCFIGVHAWIASSSPNSVSLYRTHPRIFVSRFDSLLFLWRCDGLCSAMLWLHSKISLSYATIIFPQPPLPNRPCARTRHRPEQDNTRTIKMLYGRQPMLYCRFPTAIPIAHARTPSPREGENETGGRKLICAIKKERLL